MTENAGVEKKMEQSTEENVIEQRINDDQNIRNREDEEKDIRADQQVTEPEISDEDRKMYEVYMAKAIKLAQKAYVQGDVPIGCVIVKDDKVIARGYNKRNLKKTTLAHAELLAIEQASKKLGDWRLEDCTMYVTLEPCQMCAGAIVQARIQKVVIGCMNKKAGCAGSILNMFDMPAFNHQVETVYGIRQEECSSLMKNFLQTCGKVLFQKNKQVDVCAIVIYNQVCVKIWRTI